MLKRLILALTAILAISTPTQAQTVVGGNDNNPGTGQVIIKTAGTPRAVFTVAGAADFTGSTSLTLPSGGLNIVSGTVAALHIGPNATDGAWMYADSPGNFSILQGATRLAGIYTAQQTSFADVHFGGAGLVEFHTNTGLTVGNTFSPTLRAYISPTQFVVNENSLFTGTDAGLLFADPGSTAVGGAFRIVNNDGVTTKFAVGLRDFGGGLTSDLHIERYTGTWAEALVLQNSTGYVGIGLTPTVALDVEIPSALTAVKIRGAVSRGELELAGPAASMYRMIVRDNPNAGDMEFTDTGFVNINVTFPNLGGITLNRGVLIITPTTVSGLPTCNAGAKGARAFVTDATANTFHTTAVGSGTNNVAVACDGTNWYID